MDQKLVDEKSVREVAKDLKLIKKSSKILVWALICLSIAAGILLFAYLQKGGHLLPFYKEALRGFQYIKEILNKGVSSLYHFL